MVEYLDKLTRESLLALFNNEILVLAVYNYINYDNLLDVCQKVQGQSSSSYAYEDNVVSHIGTSSYEIDNDSTRLDNYYKSVEENNLKMKNLFSPALPPVDFFQQDLARIWFPGMKLENLHGEKMFAGIIRTIYRGSAIHAHQDLVSWSNPHAKGTADIIGQFGMNYFLQAPDQGGELLIWNKHLSREEFYEKSKGDFCIHVSQLPPPDLKVKPKVGMLTLLNAHNLHAVEPSLDNDRIAASCFVAYRGENKPLSYWT